MKQIVKTYIGNSLSERQGVRCAINTPTGAYPLHRHDYFEFEIIENGRISHELNGTSETLGPGEIFALSPQDAHKFTVIEDVKILSMGVYYKDAPSILKKLISSTGFPLRTYASGAALQKIISAFHNVSEALNELSEYEREIIGAYSTLLITAILRLPKKNTVKRVHGGFSHVMKAMEFIDRNLTAPLTLTEVASAVHLAPSYFSKLFTQINGSNFKSYVTEQRVEYARRLLSEGQLSVTDIAFESGFGSFASFSRAFLEYNKTTPSEYRRLFEPKK